MRRGVVDVITLGCSKNLVDSESLIRLIERKGYRCTHDSDNPRGEIVVINTWPNRLIGDQQPDCPRKITYTSHPFYTQNSSLRPAGLLGPVSIEVEE